MDPMTEVPVKFPSVRLGREIFEARFTALSMCRLEEMEVDDKQLSVSFVSALQGPHAVSTLAKLGYAMFGTLDAEDIWHPIQRDWQWIASQIGFERITELRDAIQESLGKALRETSERLGAEKLRNMDSLPTSTTALN